MERNAGIMCGLEWARLADKAVFMTDYGFSVGMNMAHEFYLEQNILIEYRHIGQNRGDDLSS